MTVKRIDIGTDIARIGAWDLNKNDSPFSHAELKNLDKALESDSSRGDLFLIKTGADGGGPIDIYIEEEVPEKVKIITNEIHQHFLLSVPTGKLVIGGVEDYRSKQPKITGPDSMVTIAAGHYSLKCYVGKNEDQYPDEDPESELEKLVGAEDLRYYDRVTNWGLLSGIIFAILLFCILVFSTGWKIAIPLTIVGFLLYYHPLLWILKRNERYQRLGEIIPYFRLGHEKPTFVFEMKKMMDTNGLKGGFIEL